MQALGGIGLVTVLVGDDPASEIYIRLKHKAAAAAGIDATDLRLPADITEDELLAGGRRAERRRRGRRAARPVAAAGAHRRGEVIRADRPAKDVDGLPPV